MTIRPPSAPKSIENSLHWSGPLMVLCGGICIGFAPIGLRVGVADGIGPQAVAFWRFVFATPILLALVLLTKRAAPARPNRFVVLAGICFAMNIGLWHWSLTHTTVANSTFIVSLGNIGVGFTAWLILKDRPANIWFAAIALAIIGAAALSLGGGAEGKSSIRGDLLAIGAAIFVSCYMVFAKIARRTLGGLEAIFWLTCVEIFVAAGLVVVSGETFAPEQLLHLRAPLFLALVVQVAGQGFIITGLGRTPASIAGVLLAVQPVVAAALSWGLFEEHLTGIQAFGGAIILIALWLATTGKPPKATSAAD
jgi:drug/metabolite transporter (DMT)-like permease